MDSTAYFALQPLHIRRSHRTSGRLGERGRARLGHPRQLGPDAAALIEELLAGSHAEDELARCVWTASRLRQKLDEEGYTSCERTLRKFLHQLGYRWDYHSPKWKRS